MFAPRPLSLRPVLTLLLALALLSLPFGHRSSTAAQADPALIAFVEAGGTLADLCDGPGEALHAALDCEACSSMAASLLPAPFTLYSPATGAATASRVTPRDLRLARSPAGAPPPQRGPPAV